MALLIALLVPTIALLLLVLWTWALIDTLRHELPYYWLIGLVFLPPVALPLYWVNRLANDPVGRRVTVWQQARRLADLQQLVATDPTFARQLEIASLHVTRGEDREALAVLKGLLDRDEENLTAQLLAGIALARYGQPTAAREHLQFVVDREPMLRGGAAVLTLAQLMVAEGRQEEALAMVRRSVRRAGLPEIELLEAELLAGLGRRDEAIERLELLLQETPGARRKGRPMWVTQAKALRARLGEKR